MDPALAALRRQRAVSLLVPLFLFSGATSLVYETLWERQLHLVVGTSQVAVITVLAAFMTGLAGGGFAAGRFADKVKNPLKTYALLEAGIGVYAVVFPLLVSMVEPIYLGFWRQFEPDPVVFATFQFLLLGLFLLPPTICMGSTLPLLARFAASRSEDAGKQVGRLYGANTLGAVLGVALAGFFLLPKLGLNLTTWVTASGNLLLCAVAWALGARAGDLEPADAAHPADQQPVAHILKEPTPKWLWLTAAIAFLAGIASLLYEVSWFRLMVLTLGGSAYAFSIMLLAFLLGIGLGGWGGGRLADRALSRGGLPGVLKLVAGLQVGVAGVAWAFMFTYNELPFVFVQVYDAIEATPQLLWPAKLCIAVGVMLPPALLMGATFPALVRATAMSSRLGGPVGRIYGWNTVGAILGASIGGLLLLPSLQVRGTVLVAISVNLIASVLAARAASQAEGGRSPLIQVGWALAALWAIGLIHWKKPPWDPLLMTAGMYKYVSDLAPESRSREGVLDFAVRPYKLIFYEEGLSSVVTVAQAHDSDNIWLANNGKVDASTRVDMPTQVLCAHLPFLFAPEARDIGVIGLASGITAGSVTLHSVPTRIDIIELEPAIVKASHFFDDWNHKPLEDPRVRLIANDARNHLNLLPDGTYDLIISEPSNPWLTGVSNLFTREFFFLGKSKLREGGVWSQWVQMYGMDEHDLRTLLRTFSESYAHVRLFSTIEDADLVLIGSDAPLALDVDVVARTLDREAKVAAEMREVDIVYPEDLLTRYQLDRQAILAFAGDAPLNTDDNMRIEYSAPLHLHEDTAQRNFFVLLDGTEARGQVPTEMVEGVEGRIDLSRAYARRGDWLKALLALKEAEAEEPGNPVVFELYDRYQRALQAEMNDEELPPDAKIDMDPRELDPASDEDDIEP